MRTTHHERQVKQQTTTNSLTRPHNHNVPLLGICPACLGCEACRGTSRSTRRTAAHQVPKISLRNFVKKKTTVHHHNTIFMFASIHVSRVTASCRAGPEPTYDCSPLSVLRNMWGTRHAMMDCRMNATSNCCRQAGVAR